MRASRANLLALLAFARFARAKNRRGGGPINLGKKNPGGVKRSKNIARGSLPPPPRPPCTCMADSQEQQQEHSKM
jgi:hypothetical protein